MSALRFLASILMLWSAAAAEAKSLGKQLDGEWRLVSSEQVLTDGTRGPSPLYGPGGVGFLIFTDEGDMCAILGKSASSPKSGNSPAGNGLDAYCGKYQVNEGERSIVFDVVFDAVPNDLGGGLKRTISFDGDKLKLRSLKPHTGIEEYTLTLQRM